MAYSQPSSRFWNSSTQTASQIFKELEEKKLFAAWPFAIRGNGPYSQFQKGRTGYGRIEKKWKSVLPEQELIDEGDLIMAI